MFHLKDVDVYTFWGGGVWESVCFVHLFKHWQLAPYKHAPENAHLFKM